MRTIALAAVIAAVLPGCASIVTGHNQPITVETPECEGAKCKLMNDKGSWFVTTPGSVIVSRAFGDLTISCSKEGYGSLSHVVSSSTKAMAAGNILFGGLIGVGVDVATGAAYDYPSPIYHPFSCRGPAKDK